MTAGWRECADPVELAAAAADPDVEVQWNNKPGWSPGAWGQSTASSEASFAAAMREGNRYRVPASWSWSPEPPADVPTGAERYLADRLADPEYRDAYEAAAPDDLVSRARRHAETHPESRDLIEELLAVRALVVPTPLHGDLRERIAAAIYEDDNDEPWADAAPSDKNAYRCNADAVLAVLPAPPVPPSGDENDNIARLTEDQGDRIVNACCRILGCEPADIDGDAAYEEVLTEAVERCADLHGQDRWEDDCHGCGFRVGDHTTDGRCPPVPPWPGAVLSGVVDEDGVPTWLAQAGQVRGEQVRCSRNLSWTKTWGYGPGMWVEVRAPRAVPEPETERVQAWEAVRDGRQVVGASSPFEAHYIWRSGPGRAFIGERTMDKAVLVAPDGTVEVLKDGDR